MEGGVDWNAMDKAIARSERMARVQDVATMEARVPLLNSYVGFCM